MSALSLRALPRILAEGWNRLLFAPVDARSVGLLRVLIGAVIVGSHLLTWPETAALMGPAGDLGGQRQRMDPLLWSPYLHLEDPGALLLLHGLLLVFPLLFCLGLGGRWMGLLALLVQIAWEHAAPAMTDGGDRLLRLVTFSLLLVPCTRALSLDALLARRRGPALPAAPSTAPPTVPITAHRLIQLQLIVVYLQTGLEKLPEAPWREGSAVYYALASLNFARFPAFTDAVLLHPVVRPLLQLGTWVTLGWEISFGLLVLFRPTRRLALLIGLLMHGGIALFMKIGVFSWVMLSCYIVFLDPAWVGARVERALARLRPET